MSTHKKVGFYTLGCKLNFSETSTIAREFESGGFVRATKGEKSDIYVINSCSVTEHADKKCRNLVRKLIKDNPEARVVVTGCYAQLKPQELAAIDGVDLVIGNNDKGTIFERVVGLNDHGKGRSAIHTCEAEELTGFFAAFSSGDRTRSFLKVQDGCNYRCSYCTIPLARGESRNIAINEIVAEAEKIAAAGQREIVITGINTGDFGHTTGESFLDLLKAIDKVEGIDRYRISSIEPNLLSDEVIDFTTQSSKFQPHFHIPLQSGCDKILALMRRRYNTATFAERIATVRSRMPNVFLGIDVIVGFPGETDDDFMETYRFLEQQHPAFIHIFPYSVRANTPAAELPDRVSPQASAQRVKMLGELCQKLHYEFASQFVDKEVEVLWESTRHEGYMFGYSTNYVKVRTPYDKSLINKISRVTPSGVDDDATLCVAQSDSFGK